MPIRFKQLSPRTILAGMIILFLGPFLIVGLFPSQLNRVMNEASYVVFHNTVEFFSIMVSLSAFSVGWFTYDQSKDRHALFLSTAFLAVGLLDFMHTMSNAAMPAFLTPNSINKSTQFWIAARLFAAPVFLVSAYIYPASRSWWLSKKPLLASALVVTGLVFTGVVFFPSYLPPTAVQGAGLTALRNYLEFLVILLLALAAVAYWKRMKLTEDRSLVYYPAAFIFYMFSEGVFAYYESGFDSYNVLGHIYKVAAFCLIFKRVFIATVKAPYEKLVNEERSRHLASFPQLKPSPILEITSSGGLVFANPAAEKLLDNLGLDRTDFFVLLPEDFAAILGDLNMKKEMTLHREVVIRDRVFSENIYLEPQFDTVRIYAFDVTERLRMEEELLKAKDELEKRVNDRTEELNRTVATLLEEILERKRAEESLQRLNQLYAARSETNQTIVRASDRDSLFHDFCRVAVEHGGFILSWVGLIDEESGQVNIVAACGVTDYLDDIRVTADREPTGKGPTGISLREGTYYICNDFQKDPCTAPWHEKGRAYGICASASIVLKEEERVVGALTLYAGKKDFFDQQHVALLQQMGADISFALDNLAREAHRREVEQALKEETMERLRTAEALREKEQLLMQQSRQAAMGEMIGNIAHQWRQPLNALGLTVQQLGLSYECGVFSKEQLDTSIDQAMKIIFHMSQTIDDFRNFYRPDKEKGWFKVSQLVMKTVSLIEANLHEHRIDIEISSTGDPEINGYPNEYAQVLLNILMNARDAFVEVRTDGARVTVRSWKEEDQSVVTITDNAGGIAEEIIGRIFDPYFTTKQPGLGTGVGLFMSKTIIEKNMRGRLTARNVADGAEFRIEV